MNKDSFVIRHMMMKHEEKDPKDSFVIRHIMRVWKGTMKIIIRKVMRIRVSVHIIPGWIYDQGDILHRMTYRQINI